MAVVKGLSTLSPSLVELRRTSRFADPASHHRH
jgi:hypothetical protein